MAVDTATAAPTGRDVGRTAVAKPSRPVLAWASIGALLVAFEAYVLIRWLTGIHFTSTRPGSSHVSGAMHVVYIAIQIAVPIGLLAVLFFMVVRPWRREGRMTTDGMITIACGTVFFWDMNMNYTSVSLLYNSHLLNMGAWANGAFPGWTSPNAGLLPEPLLVCLPGYTAICFMEVVLCLFLVRRIKARWPRMSAAVTVLVIIAVLTIIDTIIETALLRIGVYAYPGGIRAITLYAGHTYQLPMSEPFFFAGLSLGAAAVISYFRDDRGQTLVERGLDRVNVGPKRRQGLKFLAIFGAIHLAFALFYFVPNQWLATHSGPWPKGYPSYMINGMCDYPGGAGAAQAHQITGVACPGPGVAITRPNTTL